MKPVRDIAKLIGATLLTVIVTRLATGESLAGLAKLKGVWQTFFAATVPAWAFGLSLFVALWASARVAVYFQHSQGRVHFVPDAYNNGWSRSDGQIEIRMGGTFTYDGIKTLMILKAFLKGTEPITDMGIFQTEPYGAGVTSVRALWLSSTPVHAMLVVRLAPARGERGRPLRLRLILRDNHNRDYPLRPVTFPYTGQPVDAQTKK